MRRVDTIFEQRPDYLRSASKQIVILGRLGLPGKAAVTIHVMRLAKMLGLAGFEPIVLIPEKSGRAEDWQADGTYKYQGIIYIPLGNYNARTQPWGKLGVFLGLENPFVRYLKANLSLPHAVISLNLPSGCILRLDRWCRKQGVPLIFESMEWFDRADMLKRGILSWLDFEFLMRIILPSFKKGIVISSWLEKYYRRRHCSILRIPPVLDINEPGWHPVRVMPISSGLRIVFSGTPDRDSLDIVLRGVLRAKRNGLKVIMEYIGSTREDILRLKNISPELLEDLSDNLVFHGRLPAEQVPGVMARANYTVVLRRNARWSRACFPSKVPEFLTLGVPVICNDTSDLLDFLSDGVDAFIVKHLSEDSFFETLERAANVTDADHEKMRFNARECARNRFDIHKYIEKIHDFLTPTTRQL